MTESSPDKQASTEPVAPSKTEPEAKVPVAAIAKERADKREARAEAEALRQELNDSKTRNDADMQALIESLGPFVTDMVTKATEQALKPSRDEAAMLRTAIANGLNEPQMVELSKIKAETPGLSDARAIAVLRAEHPELFAGRQAPPITAFAPSGASPLRSAAPREDYMAKMDEARKANDIHAAQKFASLELFRRVEEARRRSHN